MIIISEDPEIYGGCQEKNLPCIKLGQNPSIQEILKALDYLKANYKQSFLAEKVSTTFSL